MALFHGTTKIAYQKIIKSGLIIPQESQGGINLIKHPLKEDKSKWHGFIFLTDDIDLAEWYSRGISNHLEKDLGIVILEIKVNENKLLPDDIECPNAKDWQDSLERSSQIKIYGPLDYNVIVDVIVR